MIGKIRFYPDYRWCRMMGEMQSRRLRGARKMFRLGPYVFRRSFYDLYGFAQRIEQWEGDDLQPADGRGVVIVEIIEGGEDEPGDRFEVFSVGPVDMIAIDWNLAQDDPDYAAETLLSVNRAYKATGYIEGDRFCTILDRLGDCVRLSNGGPDDRA